ncbi:hypothetical protein CC78DRAFT_504417 [Lojkania enalia]|uniref:ELYS-like domain-containing protein n=1 Tax=Lojkania enalia TaxID=147567 RepID=A0A9P4N4Q3_9PLEO|nr:hypothetical protein CC78DRAFT_504417 [Didymosphaeria enalia]
MLDIEEYEAVFPNGIEYSESRIKSIYQWQAQLGGKLFFARLLDLLHIKGRKIYPPKTRQQLVELHGLIVDAPVALHYKHCLLFYLLKDLSPSFHDYVETDIATVFARDVYLEKRFWTFVEGLWALDHLEVEIAVHNLTHPSIIPTFPDEIMLALLKQRHQPSGAASGEYILPMAYYNCVKPPLTNEEAKVEFLRYMANRSITEAFYWIRSRPEIERRQLFEIVIEMTLEYTIHTRISQEYSQEDRAMEFISLPFEKKEEKWVEQFLIEGRGRNFRQAKETVLMMKMATGRLNEVADENLLKGRNHGDVNWEMLKNGIKRGLGPRDEDAASFAE